MLKSTEKMVMAPSEYKAGPVSGAVFSWFRPGYADGPIVPDIYLHLRDARASLALAQFGGQASALGLAR
jgi:hypothetical protein